MPQAEGGGFGGSERHDPHLLYTLSAVQVLALYDRLHEVDADRIAACVPRGRPCCSSMNACCGLAHQSRAPSVSDNVQHLHHISIALTSFRRGHAFVLAACIVQRQQESLTDRLDSPLRGLTRCRACVSLCVQM